MEDADLGRTPNGVFWTVTDARQAELLTDATSKVFFKPFLARECSVSRAAEEIGCNVNTMLYRVKTFVGAGLLEVAREEKRVGRPIKHYRSVHDAYLIPEGVTPYADLEERLTRQIRPFWETLMRSLARAYRERGWDGQYIHRTQEGVVTTSLAAKREGLTDFWSVEPPYDVYSDMGLSLTPEEAEVLARHLLAVLQDASQNIFQKDRKGGRRYVLQVALVPSDELSN
jgi:hypothetical protein